MNASRCMKDSMRKLLAVVLACVLSISLMPSFAWADLATDAADQVSSQADDAQKAQVTLTIVAGTQTDWTTNETTYNTWVNKYYTLDDVLAAAHAKGRTDRTIDTLTMQDLLDAAVLAGDITSYDATESSYGGLYLDAITSDAGIKLAGINSPDYMLSEFWSVLEDGTQTPVAFDAVTLKGGHAYQFAWDTYTSALPPDNWSDFYAKNPADNSYAGADLSQGEVTLSVVAGLQTDYATGEVTYPTWVNKRYGLADVLAHAKTKDPSKTLATLTMQDLLDAAVAAGDIKAYDATPSSYGGLFLNSITSKDGVEYAGWNSADYSASLYWSVFDNGGYADVSFSQIALVDNKTYQFAWDSFSSAHVPHNWDEFYETNKPKAADDTNNPSSGDKPQVPPAPPTQTYKPLTCDQATIDALINNIANAYAGTQDAWQIMDMAALGRLDKTDAPGFVASAAHAMKEPAADGAMTAYQRTILALTAAGVDATKVPDGQTSFDAVSEMSQKVSASSPVTVLAFTLLAYASGEYALPASATLDQQALIAAVASHQLADGGFAYSGSTADADVTAMVIAALAPYKDSSDQAAEMLDKALVALKNLQHDDGGFGATGLGVETATNANSTAMAVIALCAVGIDPATSWATKTGATPLLALLSQASANQDGFVYAGSLNPGATEQGFRALVAYRGFKNTQQPYNIYTQAKYGQAVVPSVTAPLAPGEDDEPMTPNQPALSEQVLPEKAHQEKASAIAEMPATGDSTSAELYLTLALCAIVSGVLVLARQKQSKHVPIKQSK